MALTICVLAFGALALLVVAVSRGRVPRAYLLLAVPVAAVAFGLLSDGSASGGHMSLRIVTTPEEAGADPEPISLHNLRYSDAKSALQDAETAGAATLLFSKVTGSGITGLQPVDSENAIARFDDTLHDLVVHGPDVTFLGQDAEVLVSARWTNDVDDFEPELAVILRFESVDLAVLNTAWDQFPVDLGQVLVGLANKEHTLVPSATLATEDFLSDGLEGTSDNLVVRPTGVALQAVVEDGPITEGASALGAVDAIYVRGTVGTSGVLKPGTDRETKGLDLAATVLVSTPSELAATGVELDTAWSLQIKANTSGSYFGSFSGDATLDLGDGPVTFGAAMSVNHVVTPTPSTTFTLTASVGDLEDVLGQAWLDLDEFSVSAAVTKTADGTGVAMSMAAQLTIGDPDGITGDVKLTVAKTPEGQRTVGVTLGLDSDVAVGDVLEAIGAPDIDDAFDVTVTDFGLHVSARSGGTTPTAVTVAVSGQAKILAGPGCAAGDPDFAGADASLLFRLQSGGGVATTFLAGGRLSGLNVQQLSCDIPFDWTLPTVALTVANAAIDTPWLTLDEPTKDFFQPILCPGSSVCPVALKVDQGMSLRASVTLGQDMKEALEKLGIQVNGNLLITGTLPILGGTEVKLEITLPTVTGGEDDLIAGGNAKLSIAGSPEGVKATISGNLQFRIARPNQDTCGDPAVAPDGKYSDGACYDTLDLSLSAGIEVETAPPSISISASAFVSSWDNAFGEPTLTISSFGIGLEISASPTGASLELKLSGSLLIGKAPAPGQADDRTDLQLSIAIEVGGPPPRILLKGFTVGSARGFSIRDLVQTFAPDLDADQLPADFSFKNIWLAYGTEADPAHCIMEGFYLSVELHLNDPDPGNSAGTNPVCGTTVPQTGDDDRFCPPGEGSCVAGLSIKVTKTGFRAAGAISAFDIGPISFGNTEVLLELTALKQQFRFEGSATLYDPVAYYVPPVGTTSVWASGYLMIDISQQSGVFSLGLDGCALIGGTAVADPACTTSDSTVFQASVKGSIFADFKKLGMKFFEDARADFKLTLSAPALKKLIEDIGEKLEPVADWFQSAGATITGTTTEVVDAVESKFCSAFPLNCDSLKVAADAYDTAPPYITAKIDETDAAIRDSAAVAVHCFFTKWPVADCVNDFRTTARNANNAAIAAAGGANYISLHGIDRNGFGGIRDADFPDVIWVPATHFDWPGELANAPCGANGALHGTAICSASSSQIADPDGLIAPVLLDALTDIDPVLAALFASGQLEVGDLGGGPAGFRAASLGAASFTTQSIPAEFDPDRFVNSIRHLAGVFDTGSPLAICEATASFQWLGVDGPQPGAVELNTKVDAYGGKAIVSVDTLAKPTGGIDVDAINRDVLDDILRSTVSDLSCPTNVGDPSADALSFVLSAPSIAEGATLTLTGVAPANAAVTVAWGDGSTPSATTAGAAGTWQASHVYAEGPAFHLVTASSGELKAIGAVSVTNVAPTIDSLTIPASTTEGDEVTVSGTVSDPGTLDAHVVTIDWGDGTSTQQAIAAGASGAFSLTHTYTDDDPSLTSQDTYAISVRARDDDGGQAVQGGETIVKNAAPTGLVLTGATSSAGDAPVVDGTLVVPEGTAVTWSGSFRDVGTTDLHALQVDWGDGGFDSTTVTTRDPDDPTLLHFTFTHTFADDSPTGTPSDLVGLKLLVSDDDLGSLETAVSVRVADVAPVNSVEPSTQEVQYSDSIVAIELDATDVRGTVAADGTWSESLTATTRWNVDGGAWASGLPADLTMTAGACEPVDGTSGAGTRQTCPWSIAGRANVAPGTYTIELTVTDDDTLSTVTTAEVVVLPEDARVDSLAPTVASAPSVLDGSIALELRATVRDISVVPGIVPPDTEPGDITHATVTFVDRATGAELCTAPVRAIFAGDTTTGGAACTATFATPGDADSWTFDIGLVVGGWYTRDDAGDDVPLTVRRPFTERVHGIHFVNATSGAGTLAPTTGTRIDGTVHQVRYGAGFGSIGGTVEVTFRSGGRTYRAVVTQIDSLGVLATAPGTNLIEIEAIAAVTDVTGETPVPVASGVRLQLRYDDHSSPSNPDRMEVALWQPSGILLAAAHWDVVAPRGIVLASGQILVS